MPNEDVYVCFGIGGVPELHQGAAGEWEQAVYLRDQCLYPHLHQPHGKDKLFFIFSAISAKKQN